jgi:hypothetical protein
METEQIASSTRGRVEYRGRLPRLSLEKDIPLLEVIRDATYITRSQIDHVSRPKEIANSRSRRLARLVDLQQLTLHAPSFPYPGRVYSIARAGLATLEALGNGLVNVTSESERLSNDLQIPHFLGLNQTRIRLGRSFDMRQWWNDRLFQSLNYASNTPTVKDYDAVMEVAISPERLIRVGVEYEKTLKSKERYQDISKLLANETGVAGVLYVVESEPVSVLLSPRVYSARCPVAVTTNSELEANGAEAMSRTVLGNRVVRVGLNGFLATLR